MWAQRGDIFGDFDLILVVEKIALLRFVKHRSEVCGALVGNRSIRIAPRFSRHQ